MTPDSDPTRSLPAEHANHTRSLVPELAGPQTQEFEPELDAGLAAAFGPDATPGGWSRPPLLRDDPSDHTPLVQPTSTEMPRGNTDRYQLLGEIARGGMGVILKGRDPDLGRDLAFKVLKADFAGRPTAVQRFVEEAQVGGQLQHPGVVPVYDMGRFADGRPYFAMKLVKGQTLAELLVARPNPAADRGRFLQIFLQVCQTVAYAHAKGVIHRDLKPSNIMVGAFGEVLVMDWGLAKVLPRGGVADEERASQASRERPEEEPTVIHTARSGSGSDTAAGSVMGTPSFMPPEQAGGETEKLDERADVFGLGAVLCVVLTGYPPYLAETAEATRLMAIRGQQAEAIARLDACGADAELLAVCKQCLTPDRDARPRHAGEVAGTVGKYLAGVEQRAHRAEMERAAAEARAVEEANTRREAEAKTAEERKRRRTQLALAASVALLLFGAGAFAWWQDKQATARRVETANREQQERDREGRNAEAVAGLLDQCETALKSDDAAKAAVALEAAEKRAAEGGVDALADRLARCRTNLDILRDLDRIDDLRWTVIQGREQGLQSGSKEWPMVFERFGIVPGTTPVDEAVRRINGSLVRDRLLSGLDRWLIASRSAHLQAILRAADPDEYRNAVRAAIAAGKDAWLTELANQAAALQQPAWFAAVLGEHAGVETARQTQLLVAALGRRPGDFGLLMVLGLPPVARGSRTQSRSVYIQFDIFEGMNPVSGDGTRFPTPESVAEGEKWLRAAVAARPGSVTALNNLGFALSAKKDYDGAVVAFREASRIRSNAVSFACLGRALLGKKDYDGTIAACREAIRLDPKLTIAYTTLGVVFLVKNDFDDSVAAFREAIRLQPGEFILHVNLGIALSEKGDLDGAVAAYREAIKIDPKFAPSHCALGNALRDQEKLDASAAAFRESIRIDPKYTTARYNLGLTLFRMNDVDGAVATCQEAIRIDPKHAKAHEALGTILLARRDVAGALAACREAIRLDPTQASAHNTLGIILKAKNDVDGAIAAYREAIRLDPKQPQAYYNLGNILFTRRDLDGAIAAYRETIRLSPKRAESYSSLASALEAKGDLEGALAACRHAIQIDPKSASAHNAFGLLLASKGDEPGAVKAWQEAIKADPNYAPAHNNIAIFLSRQNDVDGAIASHRVAIKADPNYAPAHFGLGNELRVKGDLDGAIAAWREAIRVDAEYVDAYCNLGLALRLQKRFVEAAAILRKAHELGSQQPGWSVPTAKWIADCEVQMVIRGLIAPMPREVKP